ncbi:MAG: Gfo/Idh/MocA family oxidoreductase [Planctomycetes bacterium]|nr:Gfo/Idh/MocA family oxidoreductase [Planctomycetota bacterium]
MSAPIRWGILGLGAIARKFALGLKAVPDARLAAVGSRSLDKAQAFAAEFGGARAHGSYEALAADPEVDAIYIGTPHPMHRADAILCLRAKKAVLCEKPFTVNAAELAEVVAVARAERVFLMEAMWTRFLPAMERVREWLAAGAIGEPRMVTADFGFRAEWNPGSRLLDPALAGGGLLDVGIYPIAAAAMVFGPNPARITGLAHLGATGVDEQAAMVLAYPQGQLAVLSCGVRTETTHGLRIDGTAGRITVPNFWRADRAILTAGDRTEDVQLGHQGGNGYNFEAAEVGRCLRAGRTESAVVTLDESLALMRILDELRRQFGLRYPMENRPEVRKSGSPEV